MFITTHKIPNNQVPVGKGRNSIINYFTFEVYLII